MSDDQSNDQQAPPPEPWYPVHPDHTKPDQEWDDNE